MVSSVADVEQMTIGDEANEAGHRTAKCSERHQIKLSAYNTESKESRASPPTLIVCSVDLIVLPHPLPSVP